MRDYGSLKRSEKARVDKALVIEGSFVLDYSNRTIEIRFKDEFSVEFFSDLFAKYGGTAKQVDFEQIRIARRTDAGPAGCAPVPVLVATAI